MSCQNCFKDNIDAFEKATCVFSSRRPLVIFLLNLVLNIKDLWERYCSCEKSCISPCLVCQFRLVYLNDDFDIYENSFDLHFLFTFHRHLYENLKRALLETDSHFVCKLINKKYFYTRKNWFDGKIERFYLANCLEDHENNRINGFKNNDLKIVLDQISK